MRWCNEVEIIYEYIAPRNWVLYSVRSKGKGRESRPKGRNLVVNLRLSTPETETTLLL